MADSFGMRLDGSELPDGTTFGVRTSERDGATWVAAGGELDAFATVELREALRRVEADHPPTLMLDLRGLTLLDSSGLAVLLAAHERARAAGRRLAVVAAGARAVETMFAALGINDHLEVLAAPSDAGAEATVG